MTLLEFSSTLNQFDSHLTAYITHYPSWSPSSEIVVVREPEDGTLPSSLKEKGMVYFLEVFIAKEIIDAWENQVSHNTLDPYSRSKLLIYYAQNDAYPPSDLVVNK